jgi:hypothetical protein
MGDSDSAGFHGVPKVDVTPLLGDLGPSVGPQSSKNIPTMHGLHHNAHEYT